MCASSVLVSETDKNLQPNALKEGSPNERYSNSLKSNVVAQTHMKTVTEMLLKAHI